MQHNKKKIFNDPVYGFITIQYELLFDLISHPYFQRLRNINQLGLTYLVYPGALHTRFHHALGALHLMSMALDTLKNKGIEISNQECEAVTVAILLHDIGHGPFSHALEGEIAEGLSHEMLSLAIMQKLNEEFSGRLSLAIEIFQNNYHKKFLYELVSGQMDIDRLDYLNRDSFFTGVSEGIIGFDRILKMINVVDNELVIEEKGIYSVEKFLIARRLMYWQVYLHKTVLAAEQMLLKIIIRAKVLCRSGVNLFGQPALIELLCSDKTTDDKIRLELFMQIDDHDIHSAIKVWASHDDKILSLLCKSIVNRDLYRVEIQKNSFDKDYIELIRNKTMEQLSISLKETNYFVFTDVIHNNAYSLEEKEIKILLNSGATVDILEASDGIVSDKTLSTVKKNFLCYLKSIDI